MNQQATQKSKAEKKRAAAAGSSRAGGLWPEEKLLKDRN